MTTAYTSLLGLALPVTGELSGTWGDTVNNSITSLLDSAIAGTTTLSTDADVTLTTTTGAANTSREAILLCSGARTVLRTITAPAQSKIYTIINSTTGGFSVKIVGVGPTTGLTIPNGSSAVVAWNGSDFIEVGSSTVGNFTVNGNLTVTGTSTLTGAATVQGLTVGRGAGAVATNTAVGASALASNSGGTNTAIGSSALFSNTTGNASTAVGYQAGYSNTSGDVAALGYSALKANTTGTGGVAMGDSALFSNTTGNFNIGLGASALRSNTTASSNTAVGYQSMYYNTTGASNVAMGFNTLSSNTTGGLNTALGRDALQANTTASNNTAVGYQAGYTNTTSAGNTLIGHQAGYTQNNTGGNAYNTFIGYQAGYGVTTGYSNVFIGANSGTAAGSGSSVTTGYNNVIIGGYTGSAAPISATGSNYIVLSDGAGNVRQTIDSSGNVGIGVTPAGSAKLEIKQAAASQQGIWVYASANDSQARLFCDGTSAGLAASFTSTGSYLPMTFYTSGAEKMRLDSSGNLGIGTTSPSSYGLLTVLSSTAGSAKISIQDTSNGAAAPLLQFGLNSSTGFNSSDAARVWSTGVSATVASLNFSVYNGSAPSAAQMVLSAGRLIIGGANINGRVQSQTPAAYTESNFRSDSATASGTTWNHFYGTSSSNTVANIIIYGNGNIQNANNSYGALSDLKLKENIVDATPKLASLMQVKIRNYNLKSDNGTNKQIGVIAQELESIFPAMVDTTIDRDIDNNEIGTTKSVKYSVFVPMLIKAMQEQQALITTLTARITALEST